MTLTGESGFLQRILLKTTKNGFFIMRYFLFSTMIAFANTFLQAGIEPSCEQANEKETTYFIRFRDKEPEHSSKTSIFMGPNYNYRGQFLSLNYPGSSFVQIVFETPDDFPTSKKGVELRLSHLAAMLAGNHCHAKIQVSINDQIFLPCFDPSDGKLSHDAFDMTDWVKEGKNTMHILLLKGPSQYWLHDVNITFFK